MVDYRKSAKVHLLGLLSGKIEMILQVYGVSAKELMIIPNPVMHSLAAKYPNHVASPFMIEDGEVHPSGKREWHQVNHTQGKMENLF